MNDATANLPIEIEPQSVKSMLDGSGDFLLIDCRETNEYEYVHIVGSKHIPMKEIPARLSELEPYRDQAIVVHCHHGGRSLQVTHWLRGNGYKQVQNMTGGIDRWSLEIDQSLPRYG